MVRVCGWSEIVLWVKIWGQVRVKSRCSGAGVRVGGGQVSYIRILAMTPCKPSVTDESES